MKGIIRIVGIIVVVLLILVVVGVAGANVVLNNKLSQTYDLQTITVPDVPDSMTDEEIAAEGQRLYATRGCVDCHGEDGSGMVMIDDPALGRLVAPNLTSGAGGIGADYASEDFVRSIQHGIKPDGTSVIMMPSEDWIYMHEDEMAILVAHLQNLAPVANELPATRLGPIGTMLVLTDQMPPQAAVIDHEDVRLSTMAQEATVEYGETLAIMCRGCHMTTYGGGEIPRLGHISTNISAHEDGIGNYTADEFIIAMRDGLRPDGSAINPEWMPWEVLGQMNDAELEAIYLFLQTTEPVAGN